jgi:cell volume regulation protein A
LPFIARRLHLTIPEKAKHRTQTDIELDNIIKTEATEIIIPQNCNSIGKQIVQLGLPKTTEIAYIQRGNKYFTPNGSTVIEENDKLFVLSETKDSLRKVFNCLSISDM